MKTIYWRGLKKKYMRKCIKKHKTSRDLIKRADSYIERYRYSKMLKEKKMLFTLFECEKKTKIITQKKYNHMKWWKKR